MKWILAVLCVLGASSAMANDSGMPFIEVNDLTFTEADIGTKITFKGSEAMSLFNALPSMDVMGSERGFTATGKKKSVSIICQVSSYNEQKNDMVTIPGGPLCTIAVAKVFVPSAESDDSKWINDRAPQSVKESKKNKKK